MKNFLRVVNDFILVFKKHLEIDQDRGDDKYLCTEKFYRIQSGPYDGKTHAELLKKYNYHVDLVQDLALEMTRALNYIFELFRKNFDPAFRSSEGLLLIEIGPLMDLSHRTVLTEYKEEEKGILYQGLRNFMEARENRDYYMGKGVSEDYFISLF